MTRADIWRQVGELHAEALSGGFLATLGPRFLAQLYRAIDEAAGAWLLVDVRDARVRGFVSGGADMGRVYRRMLRHPLPLVRSLLPALIHPRCLLGMLEILRHAGRQAGHGGLPRHELWSIAVGPEDRGAGVAEHLYLQLSRRFRADGARAFRIVVGQALTPAHRFYRRMGARVVGMVEVHAGETSTLYVQEIQ